MKKVLVAGILLGLSLNLFSQELLNQEPPKRGSVTIGILEGGGSLIGVDIERLVTNQLGLQLGAGIFGFGAGINYHLKPSINSSYFSLQYWSQGFGDSHTQSVVGPSYVYRGKRWFTAQIGLGIPLDKGPAWPSSMAQPPIMLTYAIGAYFPI